MKKLIATTLVALMACGLSSGIATPASAASYTVHITSKPTMVRYSKHWHQHRWCRTKRQHHHKVRVCIWVPDHH